MFKFKLCTLILVFYQCNQIESIEYKGINFLLNFISGEFMDNKLKHIEQDDLPVSSGTSDYTFLNFITQNNNKICYLQDITLEENLEEKLAKKKSEIRVQCVKNFGTGTLQIIESLKDIIKLLSTHGNTTSRTQPGACALVLFYTKSCPGSAMVAPHFNAIAKQFPDIRIAAIDAFKYHSLNTEFGIIGLPTIMLFHQGRPVIRFNETCSTVNSFIKFVGKHTGVQPISNNVFVTSEDFNGPLSSRVERETDYCLYLAWSFILCCAAYYFTKSKIFTQIVEMLKRNWRESEARHEAP